MSSQLSEKAMLVDFSVGVWNGSRRDSEVSNEMIEEAHAEPDAGSWWTRVVPPTSLKLINSAVGVGRKINAELTMPWSDAGARVLPARIYIEYVKKMGLAKEEFDEAVENFIRNYPEILLSARRRLGGLYREEWMPSVDEIRNKFRWAIRFLPIPNVGDFRIDLGDQQVEELKNKIQQNISTLLKEGTKELWRRLRARILRVVEQLGDPEKIIRDSLIGNLNDLCNLLDKLNIQSDAELESIRQEVMTKLGTQKPMDLRSNKDQRSKVAGEASSILNKIDQVLGQRDTK